MGAGSREGVAARPGWQVSQVHDPHDISFHSGRKVTTKDIAFGLEQLKDPKWTAGATYNRNGGSGLPALPICNRRLIADLTACRRRSVRLMPPPPAHASPVGKDEHEPEEREARQDERCSDDQ